MKSAASTGSYAVIEMSFTINGINYLPGVVAWYPKDVSVPFFNDKNPSNYYAVVALNVNDATGGFAVVDMAVIMAEFTRLTSVSKTSSTMAFAATASIVNCGPSSGTGRLMERGGDYIFTPVWNTAASSFSTMCSYNMRTKTITTGIPAMSGAAKLLYVGNGASLTGPTVTLTLTQPLAGVTAAAFQASTTMQNAFIKAVSTVAGVATTAVTITGSTRRRQLLQSTTVAYTVTTTNPSVTSSSLSSSLTSTTTATAIASALSTATGTTVTATAATATATSPTNPPTGSPLKTSSASSTVFSSYSFSFALFCYAFALFAGSEFLH